MERLNNHKKQRKKRDNKLNIKNKIIEKKKKEVSIKIEKHLPEFMDEIVKEVNKQLILEGLE